MSVVPKSARIPDWTTIGILHPVSDRGSGARGLARIGVGFEDIYAGWTNRSSALLLAVLAMAEAEGVRSEIADTFSAAEVPDGFHRAAEQVYSRIADLNREDVLGTLEEVLDPVLHPRLSPS